MSKIKVGIVCGGKSSEHEISCISAAGVLSAIDLDKYEPLLIGITKSGTWVLPPADYQLTIQGGVLPEINKSIWVETSREDHIANDGLEFSFVNYQKNIK